MSTFYTVFINTHIYEFNTLSEAIAFYGEHKSQSAKVYEDAWIQTNQPHGSIQSWQCISSREIFFVKNI